MHSSPRQWVELQIKTAMVILAVSLLIGVGSLWQIKRARDYTIAYTSEVSKLARKYKKLSMEVNHLRRLRPQMIKLVELKNVPVMAVFIEKVLRSAGYDARVSWGGNNVFLEDLFNPDFNSDIVGYVNMSVVISNPTNYSRLLSVLQSLEDVGFVVDSFRYGGKLLRIGARLYVFKRVPHLI